MGTTHEPGCPGSEHPLCECGLNTCAELNATIVAQVALIDRILRMCAKDGGPLAGLVLNEIAKVGMGEKCSE
jgi:hypothetical protein